MTVAAICLGLSAVKMALDDRPTESMAFLAVAAILDALDGRVARMLNATSKMGEEIDSLADAVNFGVAPAFIVYGTLLSHSRIGWIVVLLYAVCIVLRLARFNALLDVDQPAYEKEYFVGMPAPAGAHRRDRTAGRQDAVRRRLVDHRVGGVDLDDRRLAAGGQPDPDAQDPHLLGVAEHGGALAGAGRRSASAASVFYGYIVIMVIIVAYVIHIPFAIRTKKWVASHPESWDAKPQQRRAARRAIRRAQPHRRSMARLGLRKPGR